VNHGPFGKEINPERTGACRRSGATALIVTAAQRLGRRAEKHLRRQSPQPVPPPAVGAAADHQLDECLVDMGRQQAAVGRHL